jgi:hypothetical protein
MFRFLLNCKCSSDFENDSPDEKLDRSNSLEEKGDRISNSLKEKGHMSEELLTSYLQNNKLSIYQELTIRDYVKFLETASDRSMPIQKKIGIDNTPQLSTSSIGSIEIDK